MGTEEGERGEKRDTFSACCDGQSSSPPIRSFNWSRFADRFPDPCKPRAVNFLIPIAELLLDSIRQQLLKRINEIDLRLLDRCTLGMYAGKFLDKGVKPALLATFKYRGKLIFPQNNGSTLRSDTSDPIPLRPLRSSVQISVGAILNPKILRDLRGLRASLSPQIRVAAGLQACEEHEFREFRRCRFLHLCSVRLRKPAYRF